VRHTWPDAQRAELGLANRPNVTHEAGFRAPSFQARASQHCSQRPCDGAWKSGSQLNADLSGLGPWDHLTLRHTDAARKYTPKLLRRVCGPRIPAIAAIETGPRGLRPAVCHGATRGLHNFDGSWLSFWIRVDLPSCLRLRCSERRLICCLVLRNK